MGTFCQSAEGKFVRNEHIGTLTDLFAIDKDFRVTVQPLAHQYR